MLRRYCSGRDGPVAKLVPAGGGTYLTPEPLDHPPVSSGNVSTPRTVRQKPPVRQYGALPPTPNCTPPPPVDVTHPPLPTFDTWYCRPSRPMPSPSIERP